MRSWSVKCSSYRFGYDQEDIVQVEASSQLAAQLEAINKLRNPPFNRIDVKVVSCTEQSSPELLEFGTLHIEPLTLDSGKKDRLPVTAFRQNGQTVVNLTPERAYEIGCKLLAWAQLVEQERKKS